MEKNSYNLKYRTMNDVVNEAVKYIDGRKNHTISSLKTRWNKFNKCCMGGIEPNTVYTIAGISGAGKSAFANLISLDLIDLNPNQKTIELVFSLEMVAFRQIGRMLSNKLRITTSDLYSSNKSLDDSTLEKVINVSTKLKDYPITFIDNPGTPNEVESTIMDFYEKNVKGKDVNFVIYYDHALLTKRIGDTLDTISELEAVFIRVKKLPRTTVIQLAQLNRNIESPERINNNTSHYPMRSDISSADAIFQASDYVFVIHRPELLHILNYGPNRLPTTNMIYLHLLKNRDAGKPCIMAFENELEYNNFVEITTTEDSKKG